MALPIDAIKDDLIKPFTVDDPWRVLLKAPTGSGKSTALPAFLLDAEVAKRIVVVQPRRIAARMLARHVSRLRGGRLGGEIGYVVRHDRKVSQETRITYVTDGILQRWLADGNQLNNLDLIIFDEFHERRLAMDLALADCLELQDSSRPDLKLCVMSATLELQGLEKYLAPCRSLVAEGRAFPVTIYHQHTLAATKNRVNRANDEFVWDKCLRAILDLMDEGVDLGNVLIFLPGVYEIQKTLNLLEQKRELNQFDVLPLYSALSHEKQDLALRESDHPKIIVSTNVAETSLTIPGVKTVIDSGLARISEFDPIRGMDTLFVKKISRAAADQRAGRAGRVAPGRCIRLWSQTDHAKRHVFDLPEVLRVDLTEVVLSIKSRKSCTVDDFRWLDRPSDQGLKHAESVLRAVGAISSDGFLSDFAERMAEMPLHPRESRLLLAGLDLNCIPECVFAIALMQISESGLFMKSNKKARAAFIFPDDISDVQADYRAFTSAVAMQYQPSRCSAIGVMARVAKEVEQSIEQLKSMLRRKSWCYEIREVDFDRYQGCFSEAMLLAFSDQVAVRLGSSNFACSMTAGRSGKLNDDTFIRSRQLFVVSAMTEVGSRDVQTYFNSCTLVSESLLQKCKPELLKDVSLPKYDESIRRVVNSHQVTYRDLVILSSVLADKQIDMDQAAVLLSQRIASGELKLKKWNSSVEQWIARLLCLREWMPELELPDFTEEDRAIALEEICHGALSYKQIKDKEVMPAIQSWLSPSQHAALDAFAPARIKLANGQSVKIKYTVGAAPSIALTVQRLFGVKSSPVIANGNMTLQIHICAPNQRPWQMTQDLAGFWQSGFQQMKKELSGRYPKHKWDDPVN